MKDSQVHALGTQLVLLDSIVVQKQLFVHILIQCVMTMMIVVMDQTKRKKIVNHLHVPKNGSDVRIIDAFLLTGYVMAEKIAPALRMKSTVLISQTAQHQLYQQLSQLNQFRVLARKTTDHQTLLKDRNHSQCNQLAKS